MDRILITERTDTCYTYNHDINNDLGIRISSIFVIAVVSSLGSFFPLISNRCKKFQPPNWVFFITKYFGSGVILSTGFIHLLADASESLTDPCIGGTFEDYPWAEAIALMSLFSVFTFDALAHKQLQDQSVMNKVQETSELLGCCNASTGTRFADIIWPRKYWYLPWIMAIIFSLSTPLAIGVGLGIRNSFSIGSRNGLITSGIFDAACGGILIYNSVAELMGYDFIYASEFKSIRSMLSGVFILGLGALSMAIIGNWT
ncbi:Zinc-regulated transporter 2 [Candida tropicalis]